MRDMTPAQMPSAKPATSPNTTALQSRIGKPAIQKMAQSWCDRVKSVCGQLESRWTKQDNYLLQSEDRFDWRKTQGEQDPERPTAIFGKQNDSINIVGGFSEYMTARTVDDLLGSEPFFSVDPEGRADKLLAETMQRHAEWRIHRSDLSSRFIDAIKGAYDIGEGVLKITYQPQYTFSERLANVLVDENGQYLLTEDGDYIEDSVPIIETIPTDPTQAEDPVMVEPTDADVMDAEVMEGIAPEMAVEEPIAQEPVIYPETAPHINLAGMEYSYAQVYLPEEIPCGEALQAHVLHHRDFLCPINAESPEKSDFCGHLYDLPLSEAKQRWKIDKETMDLLKQEDGRPKSANRKPDHDREEMEESFDPAILEDGDPIIQFAECYIRIVVDGMPTRIMAILALAARKCVYCDYLGAVFPKAKLPFYVVRATPVKNRWYGRGMFELYDYAQQFIERQLNYVAYRNRYHANPIKAIKRDNILNVAEGDDIPLAPDSTLEINPTKSLEDTIQFVTFPDLDTRTMDLLQMMMQTVQLRSGISTASQGGIEAMPQNSTATGINAIINSGNVLSRLPIRHIRRTLEQATFFALKLIYANLDEEETFTYLEGENAKLLSLSRKQIETLDFDIRLTMNRFRQREQAETGQMAINIINGYLQTPEPEKEAVRQLYVDILKSFNIEDADRRVRRPIPQSEMPQLPPPL